MERRIATVQTTGSTGADQLGGAFLRRNLYHWQDDTWIVYLGEPAWANYRALFENAGF